MSITTTRNVMDRYFAALGAEKDVAEFFDEGVTWLMVDSGHEVRGAAAVRDYLLRLHGRMKSGEQRELVVADGHAFLEGSRVNAGGDAEAGLAFCLVYDVPADRISAMRCYGTLARLMPQADGQEPASRRGLLPDG